MICCIHVLVVTECKTALHATKRTVHPHRNMYRHKELNSTKASAAITLTQSGQQIVCYYAVLYIYNMLYHIIIYFSATLLHESAFCMQEPIQYMDRL